MSLRYSVLAYAITPVHVGSGRSPGVVDLPFQRDSIGYPIVYASSFKGVLKSFLLRKDGNLARCLFGAEVEDTDKSMGRFIITDLIPVFYPVASLDKGYVYITTEYLVNRAQDILDVLNNKLFSMTQKEEEVNVLLNKQKTTNIIELDEKIKNLGSLIKNMDKIYVFNNDVGLRLIENALIRIARNVLDENKKSINLWTEEYVPQGTIFIGGLIDGKRNNSFCSNKNDDINQLVSRYLNDIAIFLGGKETIGKGLIRLKVNKLD